MYVKLLEVKSSVEDKVHKVNLLSIFLKRSGNNLKSLAYLKFFKLQSISMLANCSQRHLLTVSVL